jgi:GTP-binding protein
LDLQLQEWLEHSAKPRIIVATKSDKLSNNELKQTLGRVKRVFPTERAIAYSAKTGRGRNEVWQEIETALAEFHQH